MRNKIRMSPRFGSQGFDSFFGLYGSAPIAFTETILYDSEFDNLDELFDECFAKEIMDNKDLIEKQRSFPRTIIKDFVKQEFEFSKLVEIKNNKIGEDKLQFLVLGEYSLELNPKVDFFNSLGEIVLQ